MTRHIVRAMLAAGLLETQTASAAMCESLASAPLPNTHLTSAAAVASGAGEAADFLRVADSASRVTK